VALQRPWADGTTHLVFTPTELLERLVPLVPRPRINLLLYHGVLAPNAPWRRAVVAREEEVHPAIPADACAQPAPADDLASDDARSSRTRPRYRAWAELMRRAVEADVLACPRCGGRMVVLATIEVTSTSPLSLLRAGARGRVRGALRPPHAVGCARNAWDRNLRGNPKQISCSPQLLGLHICL
jgi:hypothetical protein